MNQRLKLAFCCHLGTTTFLLAFGIVYLVRPEFMPYHAVAIGANWDELETPIQILILALMRATGGAWVGVGIAMILILCFPFRRGHRWAYWALPLIGAIVSAGALYATLLVKINTSANPPWQSALLGVLMSGAGLLLSVPRSPRNF